MDEPRRKKAVFFSLMALVPLLYVSGFLAQMLDNYILWQEMGGMPGDGTAPAWPDKGLLKCLASVFSFTGIKAFFVILTGIGILLLMLWFRDKEDSRGYDNERNFHYSEKVPMVQQAIWNPKK